MANVYTMETAPPAPSGRSAGVGGGGGGGGLEMLYAALAQMGQNVENQRARREEFGRQKELTTHEQRLLGEREAASDARRAENATPAGRERANVAAQRKLASEVTGLPPEEIQKMEYEAIPALIYERVTKANLEANKKAMRQRMIDAKLVNDELEAEIASQQGIEDQIVTMARFEEVKALKAAYSAISGKRADILRYVQDNYDEAIQEEVSLKNGGLDAHQRGINGGLQGLEVVAANPQILKPFLRAGNIPITTPAKSFEGEAPMGLPPPTFSRDLAGVKALQDSWRTVHPNLSDEEAKIWNDYMDAKYLGKAPVTEPGPGGDIEEKSGPFEGIGPKTLYMMRSEAAGRVALYEDLRKKNFDVIAALGSLDPKSDNPRVQSLLKMASSMSPEAIRAYGEYIQVDMDFIRDTRAYAPAAFLKAELARNTAKNLTTALEQGNSLEEVGPLLFKLEEVSLLRRAAMQDDLLTAKGLPQSKLKQHIENLAAIAPNTYGPLLQSVGNDVPKALSIVQGEYAKSLQALKLKDPRIDAMAAAASQKTLAESLAANGIDPDDPTLPAEIRTIFRNAMQRAEESFPGEDVTPKITRTSVEAASQGLPKPKNDPLQQYADELKARAEKPTIGPTTPAKAPTDQPVEETPEEAPAEAAPAPAATPASAGGYSRSDDPASTLADRLLRSPSVKESLTSGTAYRSYLDNTVTLSAINRKISARAKAQFDKTQRETGMTSISDMLPDGMKEVAQGQPQPGMVPAGQPQQPTRVAAAGATGPVTRPMGPSRPPVNAADAFNNRRTV